jgi:hypothetical protein
LIRQPVEKFGDEMIVLRAVKGHLLFGQLSLGPELEERMIFTVLLVAGGDQLIMKFAAHRGSSMYLSAQDFPRVNALSLSLQSAPQKATPI